MLFRLFSIFFFLCCACQPKIEPNTTASLNSPLRTLVPKYAKGFEIRYFPKHLELVLFNLEKENDTLGIFSFPSEKALRLACQSTTHVYYLDTLGQSDRVVACAYADRLKDTKWANRIENKSLVNITSGDDINKELLWSSNADVLFIYPFDKTAKSGLQNEHLTVVPISEYLERHPLARAEWLLLFGALVQKDKEAEALFASIEKKYLDQTVTVPRDQRPSVFLGSKEGNIWFAAPANSYLAQLINDAGGNYVLNHRTAPGNILLNDEDFTTLCWDIPFFGVIAYTNDSITREWMSQQAPSLRKSPTFLSKKFFYCNALEADFFGKALIEPDVLLKDLKHIFAQREMQSEKHVYFQPLP